jgi:ATP-dependent Clp protease, protease subunit
MIGPSLNCGPPPIPERIPEVSDRLPYIRSDEEEEPEAPESDGKKPAAGTPSNELESRLLKGRKVMVFGEINDKVARDVVARMLTLAEESTKPIDIYINSPGGHVESGDTIHDIIKFLQTSVPVRVIGTGWVASAGAHIYLAGEKKLRFCLPNTRFLLHQPLGGIRGQATDIDIEAREIIKMRERLAQIIAGETGQPIERVRRDCERNYWMSAREAIEYGMVHKIISAIEELR